MGIRDDDAEFARIRRSANKIYVSDVKPDAAEPAGQELSLVEQPESGDDGQQRQRLDRDGNIIVWEAPAFDPANTRTPLPENTHLRVYGFTGEIAVDGDSIDIVEALVRELRAEGFHAEAHALDAGGELAVGHAIRALIHAADVKPADLAAAVEQTRDGRRTSTPKREADERAEAGRLAAKRASREQAAREQLAAQAAALVDAEDERERQARIAKRIDELTSKRAP